MVTANGNEEYDNLSVGNFLPDVSPPSGRPRGDSPLLDFWGKGCGYEVRGGTSAKGNKWSRVTFRFTDVDVVDTEEPWPYPTADLTIFYNPPQDTPRKRSGQGIGEWEALSDSIRVLYGVNAPTGILDMMGSQVFSEGEQPTKEGKWQHWQKIPVLLNEGPLDPADIAYMMEKAATEEERREIAKYSKWHNRLVPTWKVVEVEGVGSSVSTGPSANGAVSDLGLYVLGLADGKTADVFYEEALDDAKVMENPSIVPQLTERTFVNTMKNLSLLSEDAQGVLHKV